MSTPSDSQHFPAERGATPDAELARVTLEAIGDAVICLDAHGVIQYMNPAAEELTGYQCAEASGKRFRDLVSIVNEKTGEHLPDRVMRCAMEGRFVNFDNTTVVIGKQNRRTAVHETVAPRVDAEGGFRGVVLVCRDVTVLRQLERHMEYHATHDPLTGLINRREFENRLANAIGMAKKEQSRHALLYLDLDQFKVVNDTCGHTAGDQLLEDLTRELSDCVSPPHTLGRLGGDEFGVLLLDCDEENAKKRAARILEVINNYEFVWFDRHFDIGGSIGIALITPQTGDLTEALSAADFACYIAKDAGRNRVYTYSLEDHTLRQRHDEMDYVHRIKKALAENRFVLFAQPIKPLSEDSTEQVHLEILIRMIDEKGQILRPVEFIPAAERYQLMPMVDRWVIDNALSFIREVGGDKLGEHIFAMNLSGQSVGDEKFLEFVVELLDNSEIDPRCICFEITETATVTNFEKAIHLIKVLRKKGCRFAIDDFGSGVSSFNYLKQLPVDYLKIDGSFVRSIVADQKDHAMVDAINKLGHQMGMKTMAEFVEDEFIWEKLRELGADFGQGYGIAKPKPLAEFFGPQESTDAAEQTEALLTP